MRFESYEFDLVSRELRRGGERIRLQAQPLEILAMMLERPGVSVTREALVKRLWPEKVIHADAADDGDVRGFEHSLNAAIRRLRVCSPMTPSARASLKDCRGGYRFVAPRDVSGH